MRQEHNQIKRTVLLVEDHVLTRWSAAEFLRHAGYTVLEAVDAMEAKGLLDSGTPIDLVFSDINMPGDENGYSLARWLASKNHAMPVLLTSGDPEDPTAYTKGPTRAFIRKPYEPSTVNRLLQSLLVSSRI